MQTLDASEATLTILGTVQTNLLGMHLSSIEFDAIYSSDYARAMKTAEGILKLSKVSSDTLIVPSSELREVVSRSFMNFLGFLKTAVDINYVPKYLYRILAALRKLRTRKHLPTANR